ncbi:hypothetical protein BLA29_009689 [Euroglyphus maynei]|uniref:Uncharacterized protein n=1 Tax=Euroglyphus maynei TaxID=6958 RepID=A0A1Y3B9E0_EURMA|nr:hypothetical protein BLA29_009689 [Euroglyphus maynei]
MSGMQFSKKRAKNHSNVNMMVVKDVLQIARIVKNIRMYIQAINHIIVVIKAIHIQVHYVNI